MATVVQTYDCGAVQDTVIATLYSDGLLKIEGIGATGDYTSSTMPWYSELSSITSVEIGYGITALGDNLLYGASNISNIVMKCNPPTLGTTPLGEINMVDIQYDPLLETWTSAIMTDTYGGATGVTWSVPIKYLLTIEGLKYFWEKCKIWINNALSGKVNTSSVGVANGVASLDSNGIVPVSQLPPSSSGMMTVATYSDLPSTGLVDGLNVFVTDASGDPSGTVTSGWAIYKYTLSTTTWVKIAENESLDVVTDWSNITNKPSTFTPSSHTHTIGEVTDLTSSLAGKANAIHTHVVADITDLDDTIDELEYNLVTRSQIDEIFN